MSEKYLHRDEAPFSEAIWEQIDEAVVSAAKSQLSGRRLLHIKGPYGLGLKAVSSGDRNVDEAAEGSSAMSSGRITSLMMIRSEFSIPVRDIAAYEQAGQPLDLSNAARAAIDCARQEDRLIFQGSESTWTRGLMNTEGSHTVKLKDWQDIGAAAEDIIEAVTVLDKAGFHGPYGLGLSPELYNFLFRRYADGDLLGIEQIGRIVTDGIIKIPSIESGGILLCTAAAFAHLIIGQDLMTGFAGPSGHEYDFSVFESIALRVMRPEAICILKK